MVNSGDLHSLGTNGNFFPLTLTGSGFCLHFPGGALLQKSKSQPLTIYPHFCAQNVPKMKRLGKVFNLFNYSQKLGLKQSSSCKETEQNTLKVALPHVYSEYTIQAYRKQILMSPAYHLIDDDDD